MIKPKVSSWTSGVIAVLLITLGSGRLATGAYIVAAGDWYDIWADRLPDPGPSFRAYNVWAAVKNPNWPAGRYINAFEQLNFTNVHQVWEQVGRYRFPTQYESYFDELQDFIGAANVSRLKSVDSYMAFTKGEQSNGADPTETNNGLNPGGLNLSVPDFQGFVGVGELGVYQRTPGGSPAALGLVTRNSQQQLAHIVVSSFTPNVVLFSGRIGGQGDGIEANGGEIDTFVNVCIDSLCPEPSTGLLVVMGAFGLLRLRRGIQ